MSDKRPHIDLQGPGTPAPGEARPDDAEVRRPDVLDAFEEPKAGNRRGAARLLSIDAVAAVALAAHAVKGEEEDPFVSAPVEDTVLTPPSFKAGIDLTDLDVETLMKLKVDELSVNTGLDVDDLMKLDVAALMQIDIGPPNRQADGNDFALADTDIEKLVAQTGPEQLASVDYLTSLEVEALMEVNVSGSTDGEIDLTDITLEELVTADAGPAITSDDAAKIDVAQLDVDTLTTVDTVSAESSGTEVASDGGGTSGGGGFEGTSESSAGPDTETSSTTSSPTTSTSTSTSSSGGSVKTTSSAPTPPANTPVGAVGDADASADTVSESGVVGASAGIAAFATDPDGADTVTYSLTDDAGGRFQIDATTGAITIADPLLLDYETTTNHSVTVQAASTDGSTSTQAFVIALSDDTGEFSVSAVTDNNGAGNAVSESAAIGAAVQVTALATDGDGSDTVSYSLTDDAGGRFAIDATTGVITVANPLLLDFETATNHSVTVQATSTDGSTASQSFTINLADDTTEFTVGAITDNDGAGDTVSENAPNGTAVGIAALASDADGTDTVTYSLTDDAGGRFQIDATTGVISVADNTLLDYETATNHTVTVQATSTDGSTSAQVFTVNLTDDTSEFSVGAIADGDAAADLVSESAANGTAVGIAALASDADGTDTVTYSLTDDAGGRFQIDATTGVISVADNLLLDYETATNHNVTVQATSSDGSTSAQVFTINLADANELGVGAISDNDIAPDAVGESVTNGTVVGVTAFATDPDGTDTVSYSLSNDAGGRFAINATTGVVTVADATQLDYEAATNHTIEVTATSTDGSTSVQTFTVNLSDDNTEFSVSPVTDNDGTANNVGESVTNGTVVGITALATDADGTDTVSYSLSNDAGGRFAINATTGVVTVADATQLDYEAATNHTIEVTATSTDGSTSVQTFTVNLSDDNTEFSVSPVTDNDGTANNVGESVTNGTVVGITALATDADGTDTVSYSLSNDAGGRFAINATTGVITVADNSLLDYETATNHTVTVQATSSDGSTSAQNFTVNLTDANEAPTDLTMTVNAGISLNTDGGNNAYLHTANGGAIVGGLSQFTIEMEFSGTNLTGGDVPLFSYHVGGASDEIELGINETGGAYELYIEIGEQAHSFVGYDASQLMDGADHQVSLTWDNAAGDWQIFVDGTLVANGTGIATGQTIAGGGTIVLGQEQDSLGGGFDSTQVFHGTLYDVRVFNDVRTSTEISNNLFSQVDASEPGLVADWRMDDLAGGTTTDSAGGNDLTVANVTGGGWVASTPVLVAAVPEGAPDGRLVGSVAATDQDAGETFTYSLTDNAGGRFAIDGSTGAITVADGSLLDYETATSHNITVRVTDGGGLTYDEVFAINVQNAGEAPTATASLAKMEVDTPITGTLTASDPDAGDTLTFALETGASNGAVTVNPDGTYQYTPNASYTGTDSFTFRVTDSGGLFTTATVSIDVLSNTGGLNMATGSEAMINTTTTGTQQGSAVASLSDGGYVVVWQHAADGEEVPGDTLGQRYDADGNAVGGQITIGSYGGHDDHGVVFEPDVTGLTGGGFVAIWMEADEVRARIYDSNGNPIAAEFVVNQTTTGTQETPTITAMNNGGFVAVWEGNGTGDTAGVFARLFDASGTALGGEFLVNTTTTNTQADPAVSLLSDGGFVVVWDGEGTGDTAGVFAQRFDSSGNAVGAEFRVNTTTANAQGNPAVATLDNGDFVVVWESSLQDGGGLGIFAQRYDSNGNAVGGETQINTTTANDQSAPSITALNDGGYLVVWESALQDGSGDGIYAQRFDSNGNTVGGEVLVNTTTANDQSTPDIDVLSDGSVIVTWNGNGPGDTSGVFGHLYDANLPSAHVMIGGAGNDSFIGGSENDTLTGNAGDDLLIGGAGADALDGGAGFDTVDYSNATTRVDIRLDLGQGFFDEAAGDTYAGIEGAIGGAGGDHIYGQFGTAIDNRFDGGAGDDTLYGYEGDDTLIGGAGSDVLDGGAGFDTIDYSGASSAVRARLDNGDGQWGDADGDTYSSIEAVIGSAFDDEINGDNGANTLDGGAGDDQIRGGDGDDLLIGGAGADDLDGDGGSDTVSYAIGSGTAVTVNLGTGLGSGGDAQGDTFTEIENIIGSSGGDNLTGDGGANTIEGLGGDDTLTGGAGNDIFVYAGAGNGSDTITDFTQGQDRIDVSSYGLTDINDLTIVDDGFGNALVSLPSGGDVTLTGVAPAALSDSDFNF